MISKAEQKASSAAAARRESPRPDANVRFLPRPDPPRPHRWFLVLSGVLLAAWMLVLAYLALSVRLGWGP